MSTAQQLQEAADKATQASSQAKAWAIGPINSGIMTDSGLVPTIAEFIRVNQERADAAINAIGWVFAGDFTAGCTVTERNQYVLVVGGPGYRWDGVLPKVVSPGSSPTPIATGSWVLVGDVTLRGDLAAAGGAGLVGFQQGSIGSVSRTAESRLREIVSVKDFGAVGSGLVSDATKNTRAIQDAVNSGYSEIFVPDGSFYINDYITLPESVKKIRLSAGATIIQTVDKPIYYKAGAFVGGPIPIIGSPIKGSEMVSLNTGTYDNLMVDDWVFIRGSTRTPNVTAGSACACLRKVKSISTTTNVIHIDAPFYRDMGEGSLTRMYKVAMGGRVILEGGTYTSSMNQENYMVLFDFLLCEAPDLINVTYRDLGSTGLSLTHCVGGQWINCHVSNLRDDYATSHFGYGVALRGACRGYNFTSGVVHKVRHAITTATAGYSGIYQTNLPLPPGHNDAATTGEPEACVFGPNVWVYNSTNAAFDCHEQGYGITITPNANGCFDGVLLRCSDVAVIGGQIHNCRRAAVRSEFPASNATTTVDMHHRIHGTTITNTSVEGVQALGMLLEAVGAVVDISDVSITGSGGTGIFVADGVIAEINGGVVDGGVISTQSGIYFAGVGSSINGTRIRNNKFGIRSLSGRNKYRHVTFSNNEEDVSPLMMRDIMNDHCVPIDTFINGRYYTGTFGVPGTASIFGNGQFRVSPFTVREQITIDRIAAEVTTAGSSGALVRLGIYSSDGGGYPSTLVVDAGTIDATIVGPQEIAINEVLTPGLYWLGAAVQGNPTTVPALRSNASGGQTVGATSLSAAISSACVGYSNTFTGALADQFASGSNAGGAAPRIAIRIAP